MQIHCLFCFQSILNLICLRKLFSHIAVNSGAESRSQIPDAWALWPYPVCYKCKKVHALATIAFRLLSIVFNDHYSHHFSHLHLQSHRQPWNSLQMFSFCPSWVPTGNIVCSSGDTVPTPVRTTNSEHTDLDTETTLQHIFMFIINFQPHTVSFITKTAKKMG